MSADPVPVTVAVPTYRRADRLRAHLPEVLAQVRAVNAAEGGRFRADVLVVDNDPERSAAGAVTELDAGELRYATEPAPGIAAVRNRAMDEAGAARLLVFIDDDERPLPGWLSSLLDTWAAHGAAAVAGRIVADYTEEPAPWLRAGDLFARRSMPTGTEIDVAAAGNLLLDLEQVRERGIRFDPALCLGGGEDNLFTRSLVGAGGRIVWCDESVAVDPVPADRMTRDWLRRRAWSHGCGTVQIDLHLTPGAPARWRRRGYWLAGGALRVLAGAARWAAGVLRGDLRARTRGWWAATRGVGIVAGACGLVYEEYARDGRHWRPARERIAR